MWTDDRLRFTQTLEERLLGALHSQERRVVLSVPSLPSSGWRRMARKWAADRLHPLCSSSAMAGSAAQILPVLNSNEVRSHAARYIRSFR